MPFTWMQEARSSHRVVASFDLLVMAATCTGRRSNADCGYSRPEGHVILHSAFCR